MYFDWKDALAMSSQIATVFGFIYGLLWLERYRKQKIVEHQSDDARKGLDQLVIIEESIDQLLVGPESEQKVVLHKKLPESLREMYKALLLLKELPGIPEKLALVEHLSDIILNTKTQPDVAINMINQTFATLGGHKHELKDFKEHLIRIYVLRA